MKVFLAMILFVSFAVHANECLELTKCIEFVSKLTGKKYIYDAKNIKGGLQASSNWEITAENADTLFTYILDINAYTRIPTAEKDTYMIVDARDIRYQAIPTITVDAQTPPKLTHNYDFYMMNFKFKHFGNGQTRMAANSLRPFTSRYARIIDAGNTLIIQENSAKLGSFYEMIKSFDRELTKNEFKHEKERSDERNETMKHEKKDEAKLENKK